MVDEITTFLITNPDQKEAEGSDGINLKISDLKTCDWSDDETETTKSDYPLSSDDEVYIIQESMNQEKSSYGGEEKDAENLTDSNHEDEGNVTTQSIEQENSAPKKLEKRLQCQHCLKKFAMVKWFQTHKCKKFKCSLCDFEAVRASEMKTHRQSNHKKKKKTCEKPVVARKERLRVETIRVHKDGKFLCFQCSKRYNSRRKVDDHLVQECGKVPELVCPHCGVRFFEERRRKRHVFHCHFDIFSRSVEEHKAEPEVEERRSWTFHDLSYKQSPFAKQNGNTNQ